MSCYASCTCYGKLPFAGISAGNKRAVDVQRQILAKKPSISAPSKRFDSLYDDSETRLAQA